MYIDLEKGGEDVKLQSAIDTIENTDLSLYQLNVILERLHDEIIFGNSCDAVDKMDEGDLWYDYQIAVNTLETAHLQLSKVSRAMTLNINRKGK